MEIIFNINVLKIISWSISLEYSLKENTERRDFIGTTVTVIGKFLLLNV